MGTGANKRPARSKRSVSTRRGRGRHRSKSRRVDPLVWLAVIPVVVVAALLLNAVRSGAFARAPELSRDGDRASLAPLAEAGRVLRGGHNVALVPQHTPTPQAAPVDGPAARLDMPARSHDFGEIYERWDVVHVFAVENGGDSELVIGNLVTSCGCTTAELSSSVIPPGRRADLRVTFDADFHETSGPVTRLVWFATNDPTQPWVEVRVAATVR